VVALKRRRETRLEMPRMHDHNHSSYTRSMRSGTAALANAALYRLTTSAISSRHLRLSRFTLELFTAFHNQNNHFNDFTTHGLSHSLIQQIFSSSKIFLNLFGGLSFLIPHSRYQAQLDFHQMLSHLFCCIACTILEFTG
jgi:hypothetical protein